MLFEMEWKFLSWRKYNNLHSKNASWKKTRCGNAGMEVVFLCVCARAFCDLWCQILTSSRFDTINVTRLNGFFGNTFTSKWGGVERLERWIFLKMSHTWWKWTETRWYQVVKLCLWLFFPVSYFKKKLPSNEYIWFVFFLHWLLFFLCVATVNQTINGGRHHNDISP